VFLYNTKAQNVRDQRKKIASKEKGITLIVIPHWWGHSEAALRSRIGSHRPDLFHGYKLVNNEMDEQAPKPKSASIGFYVPAKAEKRPSEFSPRDCWMSIKYPGIRVYWDGTHLMGSRSKKLIQIPSSLAACLPTYPIEAQLW
jgi:hypothetical protein